jgi:glycosyltransferase involved in cell wall biosynthesis
MAPVKPMLAMLGPAPESRGGLAGVLEAYRAHGLFRRWPIEYLATYGDAGLRRNAVLALAALRRFAALLVRERALAVHLHVSTEQGLWRDVLFMALAIAARCPVILQLHGTGLRRLHDHGGRTMRRLIRFFLEQAACVVVPCEWQRGWVRAVARRAQVALVPVPVAAPPPAPATERPALVLFLGTLEPAKGVFDLLEALSELRSAIPEVRLLCAGEGDRRAVQRHAAHLGIADAVRFTGWVGPSGKRALLESAAVFVLPSYEEAMPLALLEAMAAGVPVVATPVGGAPEVVVDGVSGFLAAPGDATTLQRVLRKLLMDRSLAARIGVAGRASVLLRCAPERAIAALGEVYGAIGLATFGAAAPGTAP